MIRRLEGSAIVASSLWSLETSSVFPLLQVSGVRDLAASKHMVRSVWHGRQTTRGLKEMIRPTKRIMIGAEIFRQCLRVNGSIEHPAQGNAIHDAPTEQQNRQSVS